MALSRKATGNQKTAEPVSPQPESANEPLQPKSPSLGSLVLLPGVSEESLKEIEEFEQLLLNAEKSGGTIGEKLLKTPSGKMMLGFLHRDGRGVRKNEAKAIEWFKKAADQGEHYSDVLLGTMYFLGGSNRAPDEIKAVEHFRKAAERGNSLGQAMLALAYLENRGVPRNERAAIEWLEKAAKPRWFRGSTLASWIFGRTNEPSSIAQSMLGDLYKEGRVVPQSDTAAVRWYRKSAARGNTDGQKNLAFMYLKGRGVPQDTATAIELYQEAADQGDDEAKQALYLLETGKGDIFTSVDERLDRISEEDSKKPEGSATIDTEERTPSGRRAARRRSELPDPDAPAYAEANRRDVFFQTRMDPSLKFLIDQFVEASGMTKKEATERAFRLLLAEDRKPD